MLFRSVVDAFEDGDGLFVLFIHQLLDQAQVKVAPGLALHQVQVFVFPLVQLANDLQKLVVQRCVGFSIHGLLSENDRREYEYIVL